MQLSNANAADIREVIAVTVRANAAAAKAQARVDKTSKETNDLLARYRETQRQIESLRLYNAQLDKLVTSQEEEVASLQTQIEQATTIAREVTPLMLRMIEALETFVSLDVPFLAKERDMRLQELRDLMQRSDVTDAERYRRILEAYQIENDYGRTIEAYQGTLGEGNDSRTLNFLRVGRVALVYQTLDRSEAGVWDQESRAWKVLPSTYRGAIEKGLRIARKQAAPDLLRLPISAPRSKQ